MGLKAMLSKLEVGRLSLCIIHATELSRKVRVRVRVGY